LKRHGYYCRSRKGSRPQAKSRSCVGCAKAKARCDNALPTCSRCSAKKLQCQHLGRNPSNGAVLLGRSECAEITGDEADVTRSSPNEITQSSINFVPDFADATVFDLVNARTEDIDWAIYDAEKTRPQFQSSRINPSTPVDSRPMPLAVSIPETLSYDLRSFVQMPAITGSGRKNATLILRILTSYPAMLQDPRSPPPFIHTSFLDGGNNAMESLTTCACLMQMLQRGGPGSRGLVWRNVRLECERLQAQVSFTKR
jgi:hypothetical protein